MAGIGSKKSTMYKCQCLQLKINDVLNWDKMSHNDVLNQ